jgi:hypothetical protein
MPFSTRRVLQAIVLAVGLVTLALAGTTISDIDQMNNWESCTVCAGPGGNGPAVPYSVWLYQNSPSLDGSSARFNLGGSIPYSAALWWKQLQPDSNAHNFEYDFWVYLTDSNSPQALEFDVNQSVNGKKFIFGTECDFKDKRQWKVWDSFNSVWVTTGVGCALFQAYSWNHFVLEFQRTANDLVYFAAININGQKYYFNKTFQPRYNVNASEINVAFQMDGNYRQDNYSVWLDKVTLRHW